MKKIWFIHRVVAITACFSVICICARDVWAQIYISREMRPRWTQRYENFGNYDMKKNPQTLNERVNPFREGVAGYMAGGATYNPVWNGPADPVSFDQFGNFLLPGGDIYNLTWDLSDVGADNVFGDNAANIFNNLMIASDEFANWTTKFMVGRNLRAFFTPSTLKRTNYDGIRWDASSRKNSFTLLASVGSKPTDPYNVFSWHWRNLFGAYWESVLGDVLKLGGTVVAQQRGTQPYSNMDIDRGVKGLKQFEMPRFVYVVISDDSPEDPSNGAMVNEIKAIVNGKEMPLPQRVFKIPNALEVYKYSQNKWVPQYLFLRSSQYDPRTALTTSTVYVPTKVEQIQYGNDSWFLSLMNDDNFNQFFNRSAQGGVLGYVNIPDPANEKDPEGRYFKADLSKGYLEAFGSDLIIYEFLIPKDARNLSFNVFCANDYCIDMVAAMPSVQQESYPDDIWGTQPGTEPWLDNWSPIYSARHGKRAKGKVADYSNAGWVKVDFNRFTGMAVYGINMEFKWRGLTINGELNEYASIWSYPIYNTLKGEKNSVEKTRAWFLNAEKDFGNWGVGGELFNYPIDYMRYWSTVDDNDDNDWVTGGAAYEYPGLNVDWDRAPGSQYIDTYWNGQPFIGYYFDSIVFGDDFNHNGIIDERENDTDADLPYERDSNGMHFFVKLKPRQFTKISLGHYDIKQEYKAGRNLTDYVKTEHMQRLQNILELGLFHRIERVHDNFKSNKTYYQYFDPSGQFNNLAFRNCLFNTAMLTTDFMMIPNVHIINNIKYESINRYGDLSPEGSPSVSEWKAPKDITSTSTVHKIDYLFRLADFRLIPDLQFRGYRIMREKRIKEFRLQPQFKFEQTFYTQNLITNNNGGHYYHYFPVLRFDYRVAPNTLLRCAFQGFPGLVEKIRNSGDRLHEYDTRRFFIGFETTTLYQGFNLLVTSGMTRIRQSWVESYGRKGEGYTEFSISVRCETGG